MLFSIEFHNLPFEPNENQVFYVENEYHTLANKCIVDNYNEILKFFRANGTDFVYFPLQIKRSDIKQCLHYFAPYLTEDELLDCTPQSNGLLNYMVNLHNKCKIKPSIIRPYERLGDGNWIFYGEEIDEELLYHQSNAVAIYYAFPPTKPKTPNEHRILRRNLPSEQEVSPEEQLTHISEGETFFLLKKLQETVNALQFKGVSISAIHEIIDRSAKLSRMTITADYRIFLPDYQNMEIELGALPKALFFLFMRYPEGIILKELPDHHTELLNIYKQLRPKTNPVRLEKTIENFLEPFGNAVNENITRIRKAFVEKFDERLAKHYIIRGKSGEAYKINLDRNLVIWED